MVVVQSKTEALEKVNGGKHILLLGPDDPLTHLIPNYCDIIVLDVSCALGGSNTNLGSVSTETSTLTLQ